MFEKKTKEEDITTQAVDILPIMSMDLADFVQKKGGKKVIRRILISNNGLACVKCIRSLRKWQMQTFGTANLLKFIVMATPEDIDANAEYVRLADELIQVSGEGF